MEKSIDIIYDALHKTELNITKQRHFNFQNVDTSILERQQKQFKEIIKRYEGIDKIKEDLEELFNTYQKEYNEEPNHTPDKVLLIGFTGGIRNALEIIEKYID